jgi:hypothetical protein
MDVAAHLFIRRFTAFESGINNGEERYASLLSNRVRS